MMNTQKYYAARFVGSGCDDTIWGCGDSVKSCMAEFKLSYADYIDDMAEKDWDSLEITECTKQFYDKYLEIGNGLTWEIIDGVMCLSK